MQIQDGKFSAAGSVALTDKATGGDATKSANAKAIADDCASVAADDRYRDFTLDFVGFVFYAI